MTQMERDMKAIIFDLFGVIYKDRWKEWLKENKPKLEKFVVQSNLPLKNKGLRLEYPDYYFDLIRLNNDLSTKPAISDKQFYDILSQASGISEKDIRYVIHDTSVLNYEIVGLIKELKSKGYKIGLITNGNKKIVDEFISMDDLYKLFDAVVISSEIGKLKPDPAFFEQMSKSLQLPLEEMVLVDDSRRTVEEARKIGMKSIHYNNDIKSVIHFVYYGD